MQYGLTRFLLIQCLFFVISLCNRTEGGDICPAVRNKTSNKVDVKKKKLFMIALPFPFHFGSPR